MMCDMKYCKNATCNWRLHSFARSLVVCLFIDWFCWSWPYNDLYNADVHETLFSTQPTVLIEKCGKNSRVNWVDFTIFIYMNASLRFSSVAFTQRKKREINKYQWDELIWINDATHAHQPARTWNGNKSKSIKVIVSRLIRSLYYAMCAMCTSARLCILLLCCCVALCFITFYELKQPSTL